VTDLRALIRAKQGSGSIRATALKIGVNDATLHNFLRGLSQTLDAENVIKIAHWLNIDAAAALMGMGHKEVAELLRTPEPQIKDRHVRAFSTEMKDLTEYERDAILRNVHTIAQTLRETRAHYTVKDNGGKMIGG
jgi:phage antirepressor YoqD-like protein